MESTGHRTTRGHAGMGSSLATKHEWAVHVPHALRGGLSQDTVDALAECRRPDKMAKDETIVYDFVNELLRNRSVSDTTYARAVKHFGEESYMGSSLAKKHFVV